MAGKSSKIVKQIAKKNRREPTSKKPPKNRVGVFFAVGILLVAFAFFAVVNYGQQPFAKKTVQTPAFEPEVLVLKLGEQKQAGNLRLWLADARNCSVPHGPLALLRVFVPEFSEPIESWVSQTTFNLSLVNRTEEIIVLGFNEMIDYTDIFFACKTNTFGEVQNVTISIKTA